MWCAARVATGSCPAMLEAGPAGGEAGSSGKILDAQVRPLKINKVWILHCSTREMGEHPLLKLGVCHLIMRRVGLCSL